MLFTIHKFNEYWQVVSSDALQSYKSTPTEGENVTGLDFYTVNIQSGGSKVLLKLPNKGLNKEAQAYLQEMQSYIPK